MFKIIRNEMAETLKTGYNFKHEITKLTMCQT
jgi:hypothetical protein